MDFAILRSGLNLSDFCSVASLPIESTPLFFSDGISTEWALFLLQRRPLQQRDGRGLLLVAAHVAHGRQPWTTCRRRCTSERCSSRLRTAKPSRHETTGQACWSFTLLVEIQPREGADPSITDQTCSLRATPACYDFSRLALRISQHRSASSQRKPRHRLCTIVLVLPTSSELCPRADVRESNPCDLRPGLLVLPSASCSATPQRSRLKPQ